MSTGLTSPLCSTKKASDVTDALEPIYSSAAGSNEGQSNNAVCSIGVPAA